MKKKWPLIILLLLALAAAGFGVYHHYASKTRFNNAYVNGNTPGNLYNAGLFCESGGTVFFSNPSDGNRLYSMNADGSGLRKLSDDMVSFLNADANYVYYVRNNTREGVPFSFLNINTDSLCRIDRDGGKVLILDPEPCMYASLIGNYVYYLRYDKADATSLYKVKIDGSGMEQVSKNPYFTCSAEGQYLYYNGLEQDHDIKQLDTSMDSESTIFYGNCWMPVVKDAGTAWYMDVDSDYRLAFADFSSGSKTLLTKERVDCYNISPGYIYYQRNKSPALCRMKADGAGFEVIEEGIFTDLNLCGDYLYFRDFKTGIMYRAQDAPGSSVELFNPGIDTSGRK